MWESFEARLDENESDRPLALRRAFFDVLRGSGMRPGGGVTKKMVSFEFGGGERLLWEMQNPANIFLHAKWRDRVEAIGLPSELRSYQSGMKDGGRHSALSRDWSFGNADCIVVRTDDAEALRLLLGALSSSEDELVLNPAAITRWIERLRHFFPALDRFDRPDPHFDEAERTYKLEIAIELRAAITQPGSDHDLADAVNTALAKSNLLQWRVYWPMSSKGDADREKLWPALRKLIDAALGAADGHALALEAFVDAWIAAVPNGKPDPARQIGEFLLLHLAPDEGIYIRQSVRQDLWLQAVGNRFPDHSSMADTYRDEWRFMKAVRSAFEAQGLAPRDMVDVQGALWVVHNYREEDATSFSRDSIEAAMDAFDSYRQSGEHAAIFDAFGEPRDYWVRSTRDRPNRVYPSKPLVGYLLKKTELNGGWGNSSSAAARLHNAGFVVVDENNTPVELPQNRGHLSIGRERIQAVAATYFIGRARELNQNSVSIRAGLLRTDFGLVERTPQICAALADNTFQSVAGVPPPFRDRPEDSRQTTFTYQLGTGSKADGMKQSSTTISASATNLILYGPPGTGKTFTTAAEAVRLCGESVPQDRAELAAVYQRLLADGRIEFVTFHQSMSYEEFVEGLRPETPGTEGQEPDGDDADTAGFRLKVEDGIYKRICERARLDPGKDPDDRRLDRKRPIFKVALGRRGQEETQIKAAIDANEVRHGWSGNIDWSDERFEDWAEIKTELERRTGKEVSSRAGELVCTYSFRSDIQVGDYVVVSDGRDRMRAFGTVTSDYFFDANAEHHPHRRKVEWLWRDDQGAERARIYPNGFRQHTVYKLNGTLVDWDGLEEVVLGVDRSIPADSARPYVLIIDEINRANISKVFGELITLLEPDKRLTADNEIRLTLPYSKRLFGVPSNLHVIGTMNTADRSIALLDTALRRRFTFREMMPDASVLEEAGEKCGVDLPRLLTTINERIEYLYDREHQIGHAYFTTCRSRADVDEVMRHKVIPLLAEYFFEDWAKIAAVLGDLEPGEGSIAGGFLKRAILKPPPGLEDGDAFARFRWQVRSVDEGFDYTKLVGK